MIHEHAMKMLKDLDEQIREREKRLLDMIPPEPPVEMLVEYEECEWTPNKPLTFQKFDPVLIFSA